MTPAAVKGVLGRAWGAVGTSYHFCTFAASMGVPVACLYDGSYYSKLVRLPPSGLTKDSFSRFANRALTRWPSRYSAR